MANGTASLTLEQLEKINHALYHPEHADGGGRCRETAMKIIATTITEALRVEKPHGARGVAAEVTAEVERACGLFAPIHGPHEALAVIMEEFEEYKAEVFRFNPAKGSDTRAQQRAELIQLAAMATRAVLDTLSPLPDPKEP